MADLTFNINGEHFYEEHLYCFIIHHSHGGIDLLS